MAGRKFTRNTRAHPGRGTAASKSQAIDEAAKVSRLYEVLGQFGEALAMLETVYRALRAAEEGGVDEDDEKEWEGLQVIGSELCVLKRAVREIQHVYSELDKAALEFEVSATT